MTPAARKIVEIPNEVPNSTTVCGRAARVSAYRSRPPSAEMGM